MAGKLLEYARGLGRLDPDGRGRTDRNRLADGRRAICEILHDRTGHDFTGYKERTFLRRIERRMQVLDLDDLDDYAALLRHDRQEAINLFHDLLIGVTAFFRDRRGLRRAGQAGHSAAVRGQGSAGHGAGLGAGLRDRRGGVFARDPAARTSWRQRRCGRKPSVFATDIDEPALAVARDAHYPAAMLAGCRSGAARPLLHRRRHQLHGGEGGARSVHLLVAQRHPRSAVLADRPDLLPQPADLSRQGAAGPGDPGVPLRAAAGRLPVPRLVGER